MHCLGQPRDLHRGASSASCDHRKECAARGGTPSIRRYSSARPNRADAEQTRLETPAFLGHENLFFEEKCPFDLHPGFVRETDGKPVLSNILGTRTSVRSNELAFLVHATNEAV